MTSGVVVVDTSVAIKWLLPETGSSEAKGLREEWIQQQAVPCAPDFMLIELHNVVWKKIQMRLIEANDPLLQYSPTFGLDLNWIPSRSLLPAALSQAILLKISIYDALYVTLAQALVAPLYTADRTLAAKLKGTSILTHIL